MTGSSNPGNPGTSGGSGSGGTGSGGSTTGGHFAYVLNTSTISGFSQDSSTGALTSLSGNPFKGTTGGDGVAVLGNVLYVTQSPPSTPGIVAFGINADGSPSQLATTPLANASGSPDWVQHGLWTAGSRCLYGATNSQEIAAWKTGSGGTLTAVSSPNTSAPLGLNLTIAVSPDAKWLFATFQAESRNGIFGPDTTVFSIDTNTCGLTGVAAGVATGIGTSNSIGKQPTWVNMTVDASSKHLFYADSFEGKVWTMSIANDGTLTPAAGSPFNIGGVPFSLLATANHLYVGDFNGALIYGFTIGSDGSLTPLPGSPFTNDMAPAYSMKIDPSGKFLYVVDNDPGGIAVFSIGTDGALAQISGSPFTGGGVSGSDPLWMAFK